MVTCSGDYVHWIAKVFGECVVTTRDKLSFFFGITSTLIWMWAQLPQIYINFKNRRADGLSPYFLLFLILGDVSNLTGCLLTNGLVTQVITSTFFCCVDGFCMLQYIYFEWIHPKLCGRDNESILNSETTIDDSYAPIIAASGAVVALASSYPDPYSKDYIKGILIGWISGIVYSSSRICQIFKNYQRKETEGLSIQFFISAWLGNGTYAVSIFLKDSHWGYIWMQFPWLVGSMGPMILDFIVLMQFMRYKKEPEDYESLK
ncbi:PQ loop repeat family protein [Trichomonas vaginalis G3]|uniref:PQ loop repeat family protein n=1 Tax=Trichomonas vaginalis (strain ATCC PRA-98 / G3) TaxID=412133 RepID=A2F2U2_TRIV3|nr:basic amino acid transmembrane export protein, SEVEN transmembrane protein 1-related family [Trichomonas vaginalis G3]EAY00802.1 PQ loop repeat family protein [Trichomonas vaginalis G3]KAI5518656.1 basic amino acid transmembrane export protein, SEVEN transmembrane protein 1-related family [Trichomonas vaginalis G3]|eukprot:XP_001313731.1 PQ loop repeat family protein [Trichomonas vaginalis G3]